MSFAVSLSLLGLVAIAAPMVASVLVALFPRPYAKWFSVLGAAVSTACTIALAANFAGAGMPDTQVPLISFGQTLVMGFTFDRMSTLLAPAFVELNREEPQVKFCRVNVDEQGELAQMFGIESIPTLAVVQDRHTLTGSVGLRSKEEIKAMLDGCK